MGSGNIPPAIIFPSGLQAQAVTLVRAPLSFDLTTIMAFCFRVFLMSHIRSVESFEQVRNRFGSVGWNDPPLISAVWPLRLLAVYSGLRERFPYLVFLMSRK